MPELHIVTISNPSNKNQIRILSVKTGSPHFHASPVKTNVSNAAFILKPFFIRIVMI